MDAMGIGLALGGVQAIGSALGVFARNRAASQSIANARAQAMVQRSQTMLARDAELEDQARRARILSGAIRSRGATLGTGFDTTTQDQLVELVMSQARNTDRISRNAGMAMGDIERRFQSFAVQTRPSPLGTAFDVFGGILGGVNTGLNIGSAIGGMNAASGQAARTINSAQFPLSNLEVPLPQDVRLRIGGNQ